MSDGNVTINAGTPLQVALELTKIAMSYKQHDSVEDVIATYKQCKQAVLG